MLKNYFKIAFRNLLKHKSFSLINVSGLAIGMIACLLIMKYVDYETSYEKFNKNYADLYRLTIDRFQDGEFQISSARTFPGTFQVIKDEIPEIMDATRMYPEDCLFKTSDKRISGQATYWVDNSFIKMFDLNMLKGSAESALLNTYSAVISETAARRLFGGDDAMGKTIILNEGLSFLITGVFEDYPENSHMKFDYLLNFETIGVVEGMDVISNLRWAWAVTFFQSIPGADPIFIERKLEDVVNKHLSYLEEQNADVILKAQLLTDIHLQSDLAQEYSVNSNINSIYILMLIAAIILIMAWVNFVNLTTARALERAKEIGIRKVMGALRSQVLKQFISESTSLNLMALVIAVILVESIMPLISDLSGAAFQNSYSSSSLWSIIFLVFGISGVISGLYPAYLISSFNPALVLKGKFRNSSKGGTIRNGLVIFQFSAAIILIISTITVYKQINFMRQQNLGFSAEETLVIKSPRSMINNGNAANSFYRFKDASQEYTDVKIVSAGSSIPGHEVFLQDDAFIRQGSDIEPVTSTLLEIEEDYFDLLEVNLIAGRFYERDNKADSNTILINKAAVNSYGFDSPEMALNSFLVNRNNGNKLRIIGVVNDYHQEQLRKSIDPMIYFKGFSYQFGYYPARISTNSIQDVVASLKAEWDKIYPSDPFDYFFLDDYFNKQYEADQQFGQVFGLFSGLAIAIACLGLFGLSSYSAVQKTKEIGIRKVLGASTPALLLVLSKDFVKLVFIAVIIAWPIAWLALDEWLNAFAYKMEIEFTWFFVAGMAALLLAVGTIASKTLAAAMVNPIKSLKDE